MVTATGVGMSFYALRTLKLTKLVADLKAEEAKRRKSLRVRLYRGVRNPDVPEVDTSEVDTSELDL